MADAQIGTSGEPGLEAAVRDVRNRIAIRMAYL